jgi:hypothetical protein
VLSKKLKDQLNITENLRTNLIFFKVQRDEFSQLKMKLAIQMSICSVHSYTLRLKQIRCSKLNPLNDSRLGRPQNNGTILIILILEPLIF